MRPFLALCVCLAVPVAAMSALLALALAVDGGAGSGNLIVNGDFEDGTTGWQSLDGEFAVSDGHGMLTVTSLRPAVLYQNVALVPGATYSFSGQLVDNPGALQAQPRVIANNTNGESHFGVPPLTLPAAWSTNAVFVPCNTTSGQVRIIVSGSASQTATFDDIAIEPVGDPAPCPTPTPTASETPTITLTPTRTSTPTRTPTATRTPTTTHTPTPTATAPSETATVPSATASPTRTATRAATPAPTVTPTLTPSNGLLINGGFEAAEDGTPSAWQTYGGTLAQAGQPVREGQFAACLYSATTSTKWLYQTVPIAPGAWYEMSAYVYADDPAVDAAWLRISWYESADGSGSALWTVDSTEVLDTPQAAYRFLTTGVVQAPPSAHSANARILLRPVSSAPATICADDVSLLLSPSPTPTPTVTAPPASPPSQLVPSPTATPTWTPAVLAATALPATTARPTDRPPDPSATPPPKPSHGLLVNGGFELGVAGWRTYGGALAQVSSPVGSGQYAGAFSVTSGSTSWAYQTVAVEPGGWYEISGYVYQDDANVEAAFLRVSWYASDDGSGSALDSVDSIDVLIEPQPAYRALTTGPVQAPPIAHSAKARVLLRPRAAGSAVIYIDDVFFQPAAFAPAATPSGSNETSAVAPSGNTVRRAASGPSSHVLAVSSAPDAPVLAPQPTPVVRRNALIVSAPPPASPDHAIPAWAWVLAGGAVAAVVAGGGAWWWEGRMR